MTIFDDTVPRLERAERSGCGDEEPLVSVVVPALREEDNVELLVDRVRKTIERFTERFEIIYACDGCHRTAAVVSELHALDGRIKLLLLSRSFGHQNALLAGLDHASGRVVITLDGDLQHPPETIAEMLLKWEQGYDVVHAARRRVSPAGSLTDRARGVAYALLRRLCEVDIVPQSADFKLYDRSAVQAMCRLREHGRFNRGLSKWIGFRHAVVYYDQCRRAHGRSHYSLIKLALLFMNGVFSLSSKPLHYLGVLGLSVSFLAGAYLAVILVSWALGIQSYHAVAGWSSTVAIVLFVGGVQMTGLWLMGQYLSRIYDEVKGRPCYIVADTVGLASAGSPPEAHRSRVLPRRRSAGDEAVTPVAAPAEGQPDEQELQTCGHP